LIEKEKDAGASLATMAAGSRRIRLIAIYLLLATGVIGAYIFIFSGTWLFPVSFVDQEVLLIIMLPVFVAQLTLPFLWTRRRNIEFVGGATLFWSIVAPIAATGLFAVATLAFIWANSQAAPVGMGLTVTFIDTITALSVTVINVATMQIMARIVQVHTSSPPSGADEMHRNKKRATAKAQPVRKS
jgi:hypothetical protein